MYIELYIYLISIELDSSLGNKNLATSPINGEIGITK